MSKQAIGSEFILTFGFILDIIHQLFTASTAKIHEA